MANEHLIELLGRELIRQPDCYAFNTYVAEDPAGHTIIDVDGYIDLTELAAAIAAEYAKKEGTDQ
jgi:thioredoxin-related protein